MRTTAEARKRALIDELAQQRRALLAEIESLPDERLEEIFLGEWCLKDLLAHLVGWDYTNREAIEQILSGQTPAFFQYYDKDWRSYNARLVAQYRCEPFGALLEAAQRSQQALIDLLEGLAAQDVLSGKAATPSGRTVRVSGLLRAEASDEGDHAAQIRAWKATWSARNPAN
jgi:hypothetical protein